MAGFDRYGPERFGIRLILLYSQKNVGPRGLRQILHSIYYRSFEIARHTSPSDAQYLEIIVGVLFFHESQPRRYWLIGIIILRGMRFVVVWPVCHMANVSAFRKSWVVPPQKGGQRLYRFGLFFDVFETQWNET